MSIRPIDDPSLLKVGTTETTSDGKTWVVGFVGNRKSWIPYRSKNEREKIYEVHFNMSRPYTVRLTSKHAIISENKPSKQVFVLPNYTRVFIGSGLYQYKKELQKKVLTHPDSAIGNSILFLYEPEDHSISENKYPYVFVGEKIFTFYTDQPIIVFKSPIVGADVPYPSAETENDVYLLMTTDHYKIPKSMIPEDVEHVYDWYYSLSKSEKKQLSKFKIKIN